MKDANVVLLKKNKKHHHHQQKKKTTIEKAQRGTVTDQHQMKKEKRNVERLKKERVKELLPILSCLSTLNRLTTMGQPELLTKLTSSTNLTSRAVYFR
jgi:hypothetical protein